MPSWANLTKVANVFIACWSNRFITCELRSLSLSDNLLRVMLCYQKYVELYCTRKPPIETHRPVVTYLQFSIQVCFSILSLCRPRPALPASHAHVRQGHIPQLICGFNSSIDRLHRIVLYYSAFFANKLHHNVLLLHFTWVVGDAKCIVVTRVYLCVCVSVYLSVHGRIPTLLHGPECNLGNGRWCPLVAHFWGGFAIGAPVSLLWQHSAEREMSASACTLLDLCLVCLCVVCVWVCVILVYCG